MPRRPGRNTNYGRSSIGIDLGILGGGPQLDEREDKPVEENTSTEETSDSLLKGLVDEKPRNLFKEPSFGKRLFDPEGSRAIRQANMEFILSQMDAKQQAAVKKAMLELEHNKAVALEGVKTTETEKREGFRGKEDRLSINARTEGEKAVNKEKATLEETAANEAAKRTSKQNIQNAQIDKLKKDGLFVTDAGLSLWQENMDSPVGQEMHSASFMSQLADTEKARKMSSRSLADFDTDYDQNRATSFAKGLAEKEEATARARKAQRSAFTLPAEEKFETEKRALTSELLKKSIADKEAQTRSRGFRIIGKDQRIVPIGDQLANPFGQPLNDDDEDAGATPEEEAENERLLELTRQKRR